MSRPFCHLLMCGWVLGLPWVGRMLAALESWQSCGRKSGLQFTCKPVEWFWWVGWDSSWLICFCGGLCWVELCGVGLGWFELWPSGVECVVIDWVRMHQCKDLFWFHTLLTSAHLHMYAQIGTDG